MQQQTAQEFKQQADRLWESNQLNAAIATYKQALEINPDFFEAHANLGSCLADEQYIDDAIAHYKTAIELRPDIPQLNSNLAEIYNKASKFDEAVAAAKKTLAVIPDFVPALNNLGVAYFYLNDTENAFQCLEKANTLAPDQYEILLNLGNCHADVAEHQQAIGCYERSIQLQPECSHIYHKLAISMGKLGRYEEVITNYRKTIELDPANHIAHSNMLFTLSARGMLSPQDMHKENCYWDELQGSSGRKYQFKYDRPLKLKDRLRIGYVSPDFRKHSVSYFFEPIIKNHNHARYEIYCYSNVYKEDATTERLKNWADHWRKIDSMPDKEVAELVHNDGIDILIDLAGHTADNRLRMFTWKPAPIQATYLGYFNATGIKAIDYWITDAIIHPPDTKELSVETKYHLDRCFYSYQPPDNAPDIKSSTDRPGIVFGSFNEYKKITDACIETWSTLLKQVSHSGLLIKAKILDESGAREALLDKFRQQDIKQNRLQLVGYTETQAEHFACYNQVDICLDTFPFTGATTTAESLWMGVPVISWAGDTLAHRFSTSLLHAVGLDEMCVTGRDAYINRAIEVAENKSLLNELRQTLRQRMLVSPLCDGADLARALEVFFEYAVKEYNS